MALPIIVHFEDAATTYASMGNFLISITVGTLTLEHIGHLERILEEIRHKSPTGKTVGVSIARMEKVSVPADVRNKLHECMKTWKTHTTAAATVLDGSSLGSSAIRAVITAMALVSRANHANKTFAHVPEAVTWTLGYCDPSWTEEDKQKCAAFILELDRKRRAAA